MTVSDTSATILSHSQASYLNDDYNDDYDDDDDVNDDDDDDDSDDGLRQFPTRCIPFYHTVKLPISIN